MRLLSNNVYVFLVLAITGLYFVVAGVQFWGTDFMISTLQARALPSRRAVAAALLRCPPPARDYLPVTAVAQAL